MTLVERQFDLPALELDARARQLIDRAGEWIEGAAERGTAIRVPAFVPTDFAQTAAILRMLAGEGFGRGTKFCEWGSGLGVVAILADLLGWDAVGIEIDSELVAHSQELAREFDSAAEFHAGSFIPPGGSRLADDLDELSWLELAADETYAKIGLEIDDFQVIYVYPWPGEVRLMLELFDVYARHGAMLLSYHGASEWHLWRKTKS